MTHCEPIRQNEMKYFHDKLGQVLPDIQRQSVVVISGHAVTFGICLVISMWQPASPV